MSFARKLQRRKLGLIEALRLPIINLGATQGVSPICQLCGRIVDEEEMVETWPTGARVLVKHHGAEELVSFEFGTREWDCDDLARAMRGHPWFKPETMAMNETKFAAQCPDYEPTPDGKIFGGIIGPDGNVLPPSAPANDTKREAS